jgi:hypothetical protein
MSTLAQFATIPNTGTHTALKRLAEAFLEATKNSNKAPPVATLFLRSGVSLRGSVIALSTDDPLSVLFVPAESETDLIYILVTEISGVVVHNAVGLIETLSDGRIAKPMTNAPSMAELHKLAKAATDELNTMTEGKMSISFQEPAGNSPPAVYHGLYHALRDVFIILRKKASEELGRQHLHERGFQFVIRTAESAEVQVRDNHFQVLVGVDGEQVERVTRESIRSNIEEFI